MDWSNAKMSPAKVLCLSINVFSLHGVIGDSFFTSPTGDWTAILRGHPSHAKIYPLAVQREYLHFSVNFDCLKTLSIGPALGIEPATFRSAVKCFTD